jgi:hypothetical protein
MMVSMTDRSIARLAMVQEARLSRDPSAVGSRSPAVRRYRLVRLAPLTGPVATRFAQLRSGTGVRPA